MALRIFLSAIFLNIAIASPLLAVTTPPGWKSDYYAALVEAKRSGKPLILDVYAPWCGYCEKLHNEVYPDPAFKRASSGFIKVSINGEEHAEIIERFEISGTPAILFLDPSGNEIDRISGYVKTSVMTRTIARVQNLVKNRPNLFAAIEKNPESLVENYRLGVHYTEIHSHEKALAHYMKAWNTKERGDIAVRESAVYNAALSSMELKDYIHAISCWNTYLTVHRVQDEDHAFARLYRGMSFKSMGMRDQAKADIEFAAKSLTAPEERAIALRHLSDLK
jgi:thioredoxin-related protein